MWVNMDETAIKYHYTKKAGHKTKEANAEVKAQMVDRVSHRDAKSHCTLVSTVATDTAAQERMPQLFTPNTTGRKKAWAAAKKNNTHSNVHIHLDSTGWMTIEIMMMYLDMLAKVFKELGKNKVVLVMDCHRAHVAVRVLKKIKKLKWKVLLVPSKLTWLLQPLDCYFFSNLKRSLFRVHIDNRVKSKTGKVSFDQWSTTMIAKVDSMHQIADGKTMFEKCAFRTPMKTMPKKIQPYLPDGDLGCVRKVSVDELTSYMGIRADTHYALMFKDRIPDDHQHNKIFLCTPTHRLTSKRSMSSMML